MPSSLSNEALALTILTPSGRWTLHPTQAETPLIEGARLGAVLRRGRRSYYWNGELRQAQASASERDSIHGRLNVLRLDCVAGPSGAAFTVEAALPPNRPFALLRVIVRNEGKTPLMIDYVDLAQAGPAFGDSRAAPVAGFLKEALREPAQGPPAGVLRLAPESGELTCFVNGWQSWSFSGTLQAAQRQFRTRLGPVQRPLVVNPGTPAAAGRGRFLSEMFAVLADRTHRHSLVAGFLSQSHQFGSVEAACDRLSPSLRLRAQCDGVPVAPGGELATEWAYFQLISTDEPDPLREYAEAVAREHAVRLPPEVPAGWCSWYTYFKGINETQFLGNLAALGQTRASLPLSVVQLDDGYEATVGDWFGTNGKFGHDLAWLSSEVRQAGFRPGLWLAPFIVEHGAQLAREHPDWLLRNRLGLAVNAGWHWRKPSYALDLTHPGAQAHVRQLIKTAVSEWGFSYLKLDFLYAAALPGQQHNPTQTRAQTLRLGLELIREAAGEETFLLGCGCPLGSGVGLFEAMRIGPDVDPQWEPQVAGARAFFAPETAMPATRNALRNILARLPLHRRWWINDPDCLLARDTTSLTLDETLSLASVIALSDGLFFLSDDMQTLSPDRRAIAEALLPASGKAAQVVDWLDHTQPETLVLPLNGPGGDWTVVGLFNWSDAPAGRRLDLCAAGLDPARRYHVSEFWGRLTQRETATSEVVEGDQLALAAIPAHGVRLLAIRPVVEAAPQYVASSLHFTQGQEVAAWQVAGRELRATLDLGRVAHGAVWLALPGETATAEVDGVPTAITREGALWRMEVTVRRQAQLRVGWQ